jgi:hypothetical protein
VRGVPRTVSTDVSHSSISIGLRDRLAFWALAGLALVVAHDAIFLVQVGPGEALVATLRTAGHGYWAVASLGVAVVAIVAGAWMWIRVRRLHARARSLGAATPADPRFARRVGRSWLRLAAIVAIGFLVQENVEHVIAHGHAPGVGALVGPEYPLAIPVIGLITALAAVLAALVGSRRDALVLAIDAALGHALRPARMAFRPPARMPVAIGSVLAGEGAGRAPPTLVVAAS